MINVCVPGNEESSVMVGRMAVILDILALLPDAEVVQSGGSIEAHSGSFLFLVSALLSLVKK